METIDHPFAPIYNRHSRVLILGTLPSETSRQAGFYYAHPSNQFWRIISEVCKETVPDTNDKKAQMLLEHGIALWDVFARTAIQKSADSSIKKAASIGNDIGKIVKDARIEAIFANGNKARDGYNWFAKEATGMDIMTLPSTSSAYARLQYEEKLAAWMVIRGYLGT